MPSQVLVVRVIWSSTAAIFSKQHWRLVHCHVQGAVVAPAKVQKASSGYDGTAGAAIQAQAAADSTQNDGEVAAVRNGGIRHRGDDVDDRFMAVVDPHASSRQHIFLPQHRRATNKRLHRGIPKPRRQLWAIT